MRRKSDRSKSALASPDKTPATRRTRRGRKSPSKSPENETGCGDIIPEEIEKSETESDSEDEKPLKVTRRGGRGNKSEKETVTSKSRSKKNRSKSETSEYENGEDQSKSQTGDDEVEEEATVPIVSENENLPTQLKESQTNDVNDDDDGEEDKKDVSVDSHVDDSVSVKENNQLPNPDIAMKEKRHEKSRSSSPEGNSQASSSDCQVVQPEPQQEISSKVEERHSISEKHEDKRERSQSVESKQKHSSPEARVRSITPDHHTKQEHLKTPEARHERSETPKELSDGEIVDSPVVVKEKRSPRPMDIDESLGDKENTVATKESSPIKSAPVARTIRRRKWISRTNSVTKTPLLTISTDSLKNLIPDVQPVPLCDVKLDSSPEIDTDDEEEAPQPPHPIKSSRNRSSERKIRTSVSISEEVSVNHSEIESGVQNASVASTSKSSMSKEKEISGSSALPISKNRKISVVSDQNASVSPPKHEATNILFITNLVRPFTVLQLKGLLARTGKIVENGFWIDKIKSRCYVKYETEDEAVETRHALHGVRWPTSNPKCLMVDFGTENGLKKAIDSTSDEIQKTTDRGKNDREFGWDRDGREKEREVVIKPVREWDVGKKDAGGRDRSRERDRNTDRSKERGGRDDRKRSSDREFGRDRDRKRSRSASPSRKFKKSEDDPPIRLLDDLFRKTKATPCIYWLPLTAEQIAFKEELRRKNLAEHQRRTEEMRKLEEERENERRKEREREREKERERDRDRDRGRRDRSSDRDRRKEHSRSKDRGGDRRRYR